MAATLAMILSAGFGTRLHPLTLIRPKPVMEIGSRPILYYLIRMLEQAGIQDIILNLHHQPELIKRFINEHSFSSRIHLVYEPTILNTAGGLKNALATLAINPQDMVIMHGDILCDIDLTPLLLTNNFCSLLCEYNRSISEYGGSVSVNDQGLVTGLGRYFHSSKPEVKKGFFTGIQILSKAAVELVRTSQQASLVADIYPTWLKEGRLVKGIMMPIIYEDLGSAERIFFANMSIVEEPKRFSHINFLEDFIEQGPHIYVGKNTSIHPEAQLTGPLMISSHATIGRGARLGPNVIIGKLSHIEDGAIIKNSVVMSETTIEKNEQLDCAIALVSARVLVGK